MTTTADVSELLGDVKPVYVNGTWEDGEGAELVDYSPSTGQELTSLAVASEAQVDRALAAARAAQPGWAAMGYVRRAQYLLRIADLVDRDADGLARLLATEVGKPLVQGLGELGWASGTLRYQAGWADKIAGEIIPSDDPRESISLIRVPLGVVVAICAWNFPMAMFFRKVAPALLAGNTVVLKSSETTPLCVLALTRLVEQVDLPPGVLNVLSGAADVGAALVGHPGADLVSMTGSVAAGKKVMAAAAPNLTRVSLELGGKAAAIVWSDADLSTAVPALVLSRHLNSGQVCTSSERLYVHQDIAEEFIAEYASQVRKLRVGDPFADVDMGPLVSQAQLDKVTSFVSSAVDAGAESVFEPEAVPDSGGYWYPPTVLRGLTQEMSVIQQEVFGPVSPVLEFSTLDQALAMANDSPYGLSGYVFSASHEVVMRVTHELECGEVYVNRALGEAYQAHHSGHKKSGVGGEDGYHGLLRYTGIRSIYQHYTGHG